MSTSLNRPSDERTRDEFEHALQSLKPRTTLDPAAILAHATGDDSSRPAAIPAHSQPNWWPLLTALSWLVTASVWWSSTSADSVRDEASADRSSAPSTSNGLAITVPENDNLQPAADRLGGSLVANGAQVVEAEAPPIRVEESARAAGPHWLARLGLDLPGFNANAAQRRWEEMQAQADVIARAEGDGAGDGNRGAATYSSLREEFETPIRRDWFSR